MAIIIDEPRTPGAPVVKRQAIGETFKGALVRQVQRAVLKEGVEQLNDKGKPRQELVLTLVAMPGTTAQAGIGDTQSVPAPGDVVRLILRGGGFGDWIEARKTHGELHVGDVVEQVTTHGQRYDADGNKIGGQITTQEEIAKVPRNVALGIYGPLTLRRATADEAQWVTAAETTYMATKDAISAETPAASPDSPI